jgi:glutathione synthase/RimK-type ligase-like ATP-grasp enzyme
LSRVALATCAAIPELEPDDRLLLPALAAHGIEGVPAVWDDSAVEWDAFDLVVLRSTWDYAERRDEFLAWARSLRRVENPVTLLEWNTDKRYLERLAAAGVPTVPTRFVAAGTTFEPPAEPFVVKPSVSAGGRSSARFEPDEVEAARALVTAIHAEGRTAMIQPYLSGAEEKAVVYIGGEYSHALLRRVPLPAAGSLSVLYLEEELAPADPSAEDRETALAALACAPDTPLYARVDLFGGAVLELEMTEPSLYLEFGEGSAERLAAAVSARLSPLR